jgi:diguanylate cyclase (GGDEF)-like protein
VSCAGWGVLGLFVTRFRLDGDESVTFLVMLGLVLVAELRPVQVFPRDLAITLSMPFLFAFAVVSGVPATAVAVAIASTLADLVDRKPWSRVAFNVAQYILSLGAAGVVLQALPDGGVLSPNLDLRTVAIIVAAGAVFFVVNHVLTMQAVALDREVGLRSLLRRDLLAEAAAAGALLIWSPIVLVVAQHVAFLLPALLLPAAAVRRGTRLALAKTHLALHDPLTGLPNRVAFTERLGDRLREDPDARVAVLLVDLDRFKEVNDTLGHRVGDLLLERVATILGDVLGQDGVAARFGADQFAVLVDAVDATAAADHAVRFLQTLREPLVVDNFPLNVEASIGVALAPDHGRDAETLIRCADVAMFLAKEERGRVELYSSARDCHSPRRLALVGELPQAISERQLVVHYQPKGDLETGMVTGVEALVRWQHPKYGLLPPGEFVPLAEPTLHIEALTEYVLSAALEQWQRWRDVGLDLSVAVNIPVQVLRTGQLAGRVTALLARWQVPPEALELEITESTLMSDCADALAALDAIGVRLAIDDFGTGYSSLAYLKRMPVDTLKIDRSFVGAMSTSSSDGVIVHSTLLLARSLGLATVAEGVEDARTWELLSRLGCDAAQGYFLSKPRPAAELTPWLQHNVRVCRTRLDIALEGGKAS